MSVQELLNFIITEDPIYTNGDLKIMFVNNYNNGVIKVKHYGWDCPSMHDDIYPLENGIGSVDDCRRSLENRLIINFESDHHPPRIYLSIEVLSINTIFIRHDQCQRNSMELNLLRPLKT